MPLENSDNDFLKTYGGLGGVLSGAPLKSAANPTLSTNTDKVLGAIDGIHNPISNPLVLKDAVNKDPFGIAYLNRVANGLPKPPKPTEDSSFFGDMWKGTKGLLSDKDFMAGVTGAGQLALGLANYLEMKPLLQEQLGTLRQNRQIAQERWANQKAAASAGTDAWKAAASRLKKAHS